MVNLPNPGSGWQSENGHPFTDPPSSSSTSAMKQRMPDAAKGATALNASDLGSGSLHLSAPDGGVGAPGSPSNAPDPHIWPAGGISGWPFGVLWAANGSPNPTAWADAAPSNFLHGTLTGR